MTYHTAIDMWSLGCILAELYTGYPIFPGEDEVEQLLYIMEVCGKPSMSMLQQCNRSRKFFDEKGEVKVLTNSRGVYRLPGSKQLGNVLQCRDNTFISFLKR